MGSWIKKLLLSILAIFVILIVLLFVFGDVKINRNVKKVEFKESNFFKEYYNTDDLILVNVWATYCAPCIAEVPELEKINNTNVKLVTISLDKDSIVLKKFLSKNDFFSSRDITLLNKNSIEDILEKIEIPGVFNEAVGFKIKAPIIPYTVLLKNKKILYKSSDGLNIETINRIIESNQ